MDQLLLIVNVACCLLLAALTAWAILSERVHDGVVVKAGLIAACIGFAAVGLLLAAGEGGQRLGRALGLLHGGLLVMAAGVAWRLHRRPRSQFLSHWMDVEDAQRGSRL